MLRKIAVSLLMAIGGAAQAAEWTWTWQPAEGEGVPSVSVAPFLYGKRWAYTLEIDDGPVTTLSVAQPLLARYAYTDAPPGVIGGTPRPFVGGASVVVQSTGTHNNTVLTWDDLRKLQMAGWGVINHSYFHAGRTWGDPPEILTADQFRRDLFWSQAVIAEEVGNGRGATHFVYPNGYTDYSSYLAEFGMRSGSRVSGSGARAIYGEKANFLDMNRTYLDEGSWANGGKGDAMWAFPATMEEGDVHVDFTHGIAADVESANYKRWQVRIEAIAAKHGKDGADDVWSAPTGDILDYVSARKAAKVSVSSGKLTVSVPDDLPGTRLTLAISGIKAPQLEIPKRGLIYRDGDTVWLTTPVIGQRGAALAHPRVTRIYSGEVKAMTWEKPIQLAAVRFLQNEPVTTGFELKADVTTADGKVESLVAPAQRHPSQAWGRWLLCNTVPLRPAVVAKSLEVSRDKSIGRMEVWAIEEQ